ncbi:MAG: Tic20 family protein [Geitlerinemataceae cyanobacterium]
MNQPDSHSATDRLFSSLVYLLPLFDGMSFGAFIFQQFHLESVAAVLFVIYRSLPLQPFTNLILFFVFLFAIVRNPKVPHFIRFNTMQALLLDIVLLLCGLILDILSTGLQGQLLLETLYNTIFFGLIAAIGYSVFQSIRGRYAEIPILSDAVAMQVRDF